MDEAGFDSLTAAERGVLRAALGRTNDQIGKLLGISPNTVATHLMSARRKLGGVSKGDAARAFQGWESAHPFPTSPSSVMVNGTPGCEPALAGGECLEEERTPFAPEPGPRPVPQQENHHERYRPYERTILILVITTLLLACLAYLPSLSRTAQEIASRFYSSRRANH